MQKTYLINNVFVKVVIGSSVSCKAQENSTIMLTNIKYSFHVDVGIRDRQVTDSYEKNIHKTDKMFAIDQNRVNTKIKNSIYNFIVFFDRMFLQQ
jgi:hypothetical protein